MSTPTSAATLRRTQAKHNALPLVSRVITRPKPTQHSNQTYRNSPIREPMAPNLTGICDMDVGYVQRVEETGGFVAYNVITWIHFLLGTPGHLLIMVAFYKQRKDESAYMYQVFVTVSEMLELQAWALLVLTKKFLSGAEYTAGYSWYKQSYFLMFYAGKLAYNLFQIFFTSSLLLSVAMSADRVFALAYPVKYKNVNGRRHQMLALVACLCIAVAASFNDVLVIVEDGDQYAILFSYAASRSFFAVFMGMFCNVVRCVCLVALIALNVVLVLLYRKRLKKVAQMTVRDENEKRRKAAERTLFAFTISQSLFQGLSVLSSVLYYTFSYFSSFFARCSRYEFYPIMDAVVDVCDLAQLYVTFAVSEKLRRSIWRVLRCRNNEGATTTPVRNIAS